MEEIQLIEILNSLELGLSENGLSALVVQERLSAVEGRAEKPTRQEMEELRYDSSRRSTDHPQRVRAVDVRLRPLTTGERLATLLDLIEAAVGGTYAIEMRLRSNSNLDPQGRDAELLIEAKYYTKPVGLGTGREFLGLSADISAKQKVFVATIASDSVTGLLSGKKVSHDIGVLPRRRGETSLLGLIQRTLRDYRSRR